MRRHTPRASCARTTRRYSRRRRTGYAQHTAHPLLGEEVFVGSGAGDDARGQRTVGGGADQREVGLRQHVIPLQHSADSRGITHTLPVQTRLRQVQRLSRRLSRLHQLLRHLRHAPPTSFLAPPHVLAVVAPLLLEPLLRLQCTRWTRSTMTRALSPCMVT